MKLKDLYQKHSGKVSQKWSIYLNQYEEKLNHYKKLPIKLLEIGIENGGSLEIYSKYFPNAEIILGCDKNINCEKLKYTESNIKVIAGDIKEDATKRKINKYSKFDIIIDDGSHGSIDIVHTFCSYFNSLKDGGIFIVEDLHCSYWQKWGGGIFYPLSSINFFKKIVDILNYEHWGIDQKKNWLLREFSSNYKINLNDLELDKMHSVEFVNSLCFIRKKTKEENKLGDIIISGKDALIYPEIIKPNKQTIKTPDENKNPWINKDLLPEEDLVISKNKIKKLEDHISVLLEKVKDLEKN